MKHILIIGCGFGGLFALRRIASYRKPLQITVIDERKQFHFLPLLPDIIGRGLDPHFLVYPIAKLCKRYKADYSNETVLSIDHINRQVHTNNASHSYDFLIVSGGAETNFYGNDTIRNHSLKLETVDDAESIRTHIIKSNHDSYVVAGGGYTGIEIAANIRILLNQLGKKGTVSIIERAPDILGSLPAWIKNYTKKQLTNLAITTIPHTTIERIDDTGAYCSSGQSISNCSVVWAAGVKTKDFLKSLPGNRNNQGRIEVNKHLSITENLYLIGDNALFSRPSKPPLRMGVQFTITQARCAVDNIIRCINAKPMRRYRPLDPGYVIPLANNRSSGYALGIPIKGFAATFLHFFMSIYRSFSFKNKFGIVRNLIAGSLFPRTKLRKTH
ncbi:MAG: hypothetical protein GF384_05250 [Elusimicrobia bacterium]|nr:hypothetical protein [Elusimicrobiota bacterium]MBD3412198.1 hypothetical protein [Elusimicrobiota bacterium]